MAQATTTPIIKKKNAQTIKAVNQSNDTIKKVEPTKVVDNNVKTIDSLEGVPEMWLEPATEPVEESIVAEKPAPTVKPREKKTKTS